MSTKKNKAAPKAAAPKPQKTSEAGVALVSLDNIELRQPARNRVSRFDAPAIRLIEALEAGKTNQAFHVELKKPLEKVKTYLYNALQKSLRKHRPDTLYRVSLRTDPAGKNAYLTIAPREKAKG